MKIDKEKQYDFIGEKWEMNVYFEFKLKIPFVNYGLFIKYKEETSNYCIKPLDKIRIHSQRAIFMKNKETGKYEYMRVNPESGVLEP